MLVEPVDEIDAYNMDGDTAKFENKRAVGIFLFGKLIGEIAVFDDSYFAVG